MVYSQAYASSVGMILSICLAQSTRLYLTDVNSSINGFGMTQVYKIRKLWPVYYV
uniref:Uncharacterized protein n=1 Tax=Kalanchoe fedtschenkoi TaxID=63787 RepID=A0A7N0U0H8_KALFE